MRSTLLVGLDNPRSERPALALFPRPEGGTGARLRDLIGESVDGYSSGKYYMDFHRTNLYPTRSAPSGPGSLQSDLDAFQFVVILADIVHIDDVVLLGTRVVRAFSKTFDIELDWLHSAVPGPRPRRWWALPHPSGRCRWYNNPENRQHASKLLAQLRPQTRAQKYAQKLSEAQQEVTNG